MTFGVRVMVPPFRFVPGDGRKPGDRPIGVPLVEKKFVRLGVEGGAGITLFSDRFLGDSVNLDASVVVVAVDLNSETLFVFDALSKTRAIIPAFWAVFLLQSGFAEACLDASDCRMERPLIELESRCIFGSLDIDITGPGLLAKWLTMASAA